MTISPATRAKLEIAATAFGAGFLAAVQPFFAAGPPQQPDWGYVIMIGIAAGIASAYHRFTPAPAQTTATGESK